MQTTITRLVVLVFAMALSSGRLLAGVPESVQYQAYVTDAAGGALDGNYPIAFAIYNAQAGGSPLWTDSQTVAVNQGLMTVRLGRLGAPFPFGLFANPVWLGINVAGDGEMTPRVQFDSVVFALKAEDALALEGRSANSLDQSAHVTDFGNPHEVTAADTGAITQIATDASLTGGGASGSIVLGIAPGGVGSSQILDGSVTGADIQNASVLDVDIVSLNAAKLTGTIAEPRLPQNAIDSSEIQDGSLTGTDIANGTVTGNDIANDTITSAQIGTLTDLHIQGAGAAIFEVTNTSGDIVIRASDTGPVGINGNTVAGVALITTDAGADIDWALVANGGVLKPGGGSWGALSDARMKTVTGEFDYGLNEILQLRTIRFRYRDDVGSLFDPSAEHSGFVAQAVQKVIPTAVTEHREGLVINLDQIYLASVNAIQELKQEKDAQIDQLQQTVDELAARLEALERRLVQAQSTGKPAAD